MTSELLISFCVGLCGGWAYAAFALRANKALFASELSSSFALRFGMLMVRLGLLALGVVGVLSLGASYPCWLAAGIAGGYVSFYFLCTVFSWM